MPVINVEENGRKMTVVIPDTGDKSYTDYLVEAETEKTREQLRKKPAKPEPTASKDDIAGALREYREYKNRRKSGDIRKYY